MTGFTIAGLKTHLLSDPNKIGYPGWISVAEGGTATNLSGWAANSGSADGMLEALGNAPNANLSVLQSVTIPSLLQIAGAPIGTSGILVDIETYAQTASGDKRMMGLCQAALEMFVVGQPFDFSDPKNYTGVSTSPGLLDILGGANNWATGGVPIVVLQATEVAALVSLGTKKPCSDFETAFGAGTSVNHIQIARALGRGN